MLWLSLNPLSNVILRVASSYPLQPYDPMTHTKAIIVVFMVSAAFSLYDIDNFVPLAPFGVSGVLKGSVAAFFGFLGFDEVRRHELSGWGEVDSFVG